MMVIGRERETVPGLGPLLEPRRRAKKTARLLGSGGQRHHHVVEPHRVLVLHLSHALAQHANANGRTRIGSGKVQVHRIERRAVVAHAQHQRAVALQDELHVDGRVLRFGEAVLDRVGGHFLHRQRHEVAAPPVHAVAFAPRRWSPMMRTSSPTTAWTRPRPRRCSPPSAAAS